MTDIPRTGTARPDSIQPDPQHDSTTAQNSDFQPGAPHLAHRAHAADEGTDPELGHPAGEGRRINVSTVQVGASAAAAVTSALAASFFGVAGTLIGAAVGSIVSTVAGALYADYLKRAGHRLKATKSVVIQRIPADVLATTPLRHLADPADLPGTAQLSPVGSEPGGQPVSVPLAGQTELLARLNAVDPAAVISPTQVAAQAGGHAAGQAPETEPALGRPWYRRPLITLPAIGLAGFLVALGVVTAGEGVIGGPISGGNGGTTVSKVFHHSAPSTGTKPTPTPTGPPSAVATSPRVTGSAAPVPTTAGPTTAPSAGLPATPVAPSTRPAAGTSSGGASSGDPSTGAGRGTSGGAADTNGNATNGRTVGAAG